MKLQARESCELHRHTQRAHVQPEKSEGALRTVPVAVSCCYSLGLLETKLL